MIYPVAEDSFLLSQIIEDYLESLSAEERKKIKFLDMGTGSGIQSDKASEFLEKDSIYACDIDSLAVKYVKKLGYKTIQSDLFSNDKFSGMKFDLITFNPPYLPADEYDSGIDTTGGEKGDETILKFLGQVKKYLSKQGKIFLLLSSLTPKEIIINQLKLDNFQYKIIATKKLFFETLEIWEVSNTD